MIIYQAAIIDREERLGDPETDAGLFIALKSAQTAAEERVHYIDEEALVYPLELQGEEFQPVGVWYYDRNGPAPEWKHNPDHKHRQIE